MKTFDRLSYKQHEMTTLAEQGAANRTGLTQLAAEIACDKGM
jgi:hypothetical protein